MSSSQTIPEAPRSPTLAEVIQFAMETKLRDVHVALPGRVESYDASEQKANIQPMISDLIPTRDGEELNLSFPVIPNVPVVFPRGGGYFVSFPIKAGDFVLLVFNERSIDNWISGDGGEKNPDDFRTHNLSDAVALPGFYPLGQPIGEADIDAEMAVGKDGEPTIHFKDSGRITHKAQEIHLGKDDPDQFVALAQKVLDELDMVKNDLDGFKTAYDAHIHITTATVGLAPVGTIAPTTSSAPPPHTPASVASAKVKAE